MSIRIEKEDIANGLMNLIDINIKNRKDIVKFLSEFIIDNDRAVEHFVKMAMGSKYPTLPSKGELGFIKLSEHSYSFSTPIKQAMEASEYNRHGFYPCTVVTCGPIHSYAPLVIQLHNPDEDVNMTINISYDKFYPTDSVDIYDDLPI
jgi:hypothetical protein